MGADGLIRTLDEISRHGPLIMNNSLGRPWTSEGFHTSWAKACRKHGFTSVTCHRLRGPALGRDVELAEIALHKLEARITL